MQKNNYCKDIGAVKTTPDNLSSKRNRKGHISPIDFPSSRNKQENPVNHQEKNLRALESFNSHTNIFAEEKYKVPTTNPHKYKESPLFSAKNEGEKFEKNSGKKILFNLLQEKNCDFNDFGSKNSAPYSKFVSNTNNSGHNKNDSSSNSSYLSYLQKNQKINNQNSELYADNEKSDNGNTGNQPQIYIQSSPRKFNKNLNEVIIDLSKRCQTSSNSNLTKEKMLKEKSLEKININIMDLKNKHKDPILPKPRNNNEKNGLLICREENFEGKYPYLNGGQTRRSSLNIENEQNKRGISTRPINEALNSSKKERSRSILSEKYLHDE